MRLVSVADLPTLLYLLVVGLGHVEEIPDQNRIVVRAAYDLELIELEPEHSTCVFLHVRNKTGFKIGTKLLTNIEQTGEIHKEQKCCKTAAPDC